ncbi:MAG: hypothetical protein ACXVJD_04725 [Mucilaginibacter sp.]
MVAVKRNLPAPERPAVSGWGAYLLWTYWILIVVIYLTVDLFLDLYTTNDFSKVVWYAAAVSLPLAALTLFYIRKDMLSRWYTYILWPLIIFGLYLGVTYFNALNIDLIFSAVFKSTTRQELPVEKVNQVFSSKAGFIWTDVTLFYNGKKVVFQGTRTSYFFLKDRKKLTADIGRSYLGNYYVTNMQIPAQERWAARYQYLKYWFNRHVWLLIAFPLLVFFGIIKDKYFPSPPPDPKRMAHPYRKFFNLLLIIVLSLFGLFMLILLLVGIFYK